MSIGVIFWILMILWLVFGIFGVYQPHSYYWHGNSLFVFVLFFLLGWQCFGFIVKGPSPPS